MKPILFIILLIFLTSEAQTFSGLIFQLFVSIITLTILTTNKNHDNYKIHKTTL